MADVSWKIENRNRIKLVSVWVKFFNDKFIFQILIKKNIEFNKKKKNATNNVEKSDVMSFSNQLIRK